MLGIFVLKCSSTLMRPILSVSMPNSSKPMFFVNGRLPVLTNTTSATIDDFSPPAEGSTVNFTPSPVTSDATTFVLRLNFMPCFFKMFKNFPAVSLSMPGVIESKYSTTVTSVPKRLHTDPISRPITPPPITTSFFGILSMSKAPVESTIFFSALFTGQVGRGLGSDPTAKMMFFASTTWLPPALRVTLIELGPASFPQPLM
mmetsp:Transcript_25952/g.28313  ORF Transcript_25952/g.28313 Transcript_25952/m.28313 type:complete len:202 (-) Transcript_25952:508-1113(-)